MDSTHLFAGIKTMGTAWSCFEDVGSDKYSPCKCLQCILRDDEVVICHELPEPKEDSFEKRY